MRFVLIKDRVLLKGSKNINSGSVNYYEIPIEFDSAWENLSIKAIMRKKDESSGEEIAVIDNKFYIDREKSGEYKVGFVGYTIENDIKTLQISTNLLSIDIEPGAGEISILDTHEIPTPSEWEVYLAQIQEITGTINGLAESLTEQVEDVEEALERGDFDGPQGPQGEPGITPIKGTDYWTDADKAEIENYCANYIDENITQIIGGEY